MKIVIIILMGLILMGSCGKPEVDDPFRGVDRPVELPKVVINLPDSANMDFKLCK